MGKTTSNSLCMDDIHAIHLFKPLNGLLEKLHTHCNHFNRDLHCDQYLLLLLIASFNPTLASLRALIEVSHLAKIRKAVGVAPTSLGSFSEAGRVFDPALLQNIFRQLSAQAIGDSHHSPPPELPANIRALAVDGSLWTLLPRMARAFWADGPKPGRQPGYKLHLQLDLCSGVPCEAHVGDGYESERRVLEKSLKAGCFYIADRGYLDFLLFQRIIDIGSSFLIRAKQDTVCNVLAELPLDDAAKKAGVYLDAKVSVGSPARAERIKAPLRLIRARVTLPPQHNLNPRGRNGGRRAANSPNEPVEIFLLTNNFEFSAELLLQLYAYRWHIEIFFRWFKHTLGCQHFLSESENGFALQAYAALIASTLIVLYTRRKPNRQIQVALSLYISGWASFEEFLDIVTRQPAALK